MEVLSNVSSLAVGARTQLAVTGGAAPITWSVVSGDGVVDSNGIFYSDSVGTCEVEAIDSLGSAATIKINVLTVLQLVCLIIQHELGLPDGRVWVYDQKVMQPKDTGIFISIQILNQKIFGTKSSFDHVLNKEVKSANIAATLSIDVQSRSAEARDRVAEIPMAIVGNYSQNMQVANSFRIGTVQKSIVNLSQEDGSAIAYRFNITTDVQWASNKIVDADYFDSFDVDEIKVDY